VAGRYYLRLRKRVLWTASLLLSVLLLVFAQLLLTVMRPSLVRPFVYFLGSAAALGFFTAFATASERSLRIIARVAVVVESVHLVFALLLLEGWASAALIPVANANWYGARILLLLLLIALRLHLGRTPSAQSARVLTSVAVIFAAFAVFPVEVLFHARAVALIVLYAGLLANESQSRFTRSPILVASVSALVVAGFAMSAWMSWKTWSQPPERVWARMADVPVVISAAQNDPRIGEVAAGVAYWNAELQKVHSRFRLGSASLTDRLTAEDRIALKSKEASPEIRRRVKGIGPSIVMVMSDDPLTSFVHNERMEGSVIVVIAPSQGIPSRPNVMRNIVAHELGHAIGLSHNDDSGSLMCGVPAPCRIHRYESLKPRTFPLGEKGQAALRRWYGPHA